MSNEELCLLIQAGQSNLTGALWDQVKRLVTKLVVRYLPRDGSSRIEMDDLIQAGFLGMLAAAEAYNPGSGFQFTTFLNYHIQTACRDLLGIRSAKQARDPIHGALSLSQPVSADGQADLTPGDTVQDSSLKYQYDDIIDQVVRSEDCQKIFAEVDKLDPVEQAVFKDKFFYGRKINDIASRHKLKAREVENIITRTLGRIRHTATVRLMSIEYRQDQQTNFYKKKGLEGFRNSFSSVVEDIVTRREELRQRMIQDNWRGVAPLE